MKKYTCTMFCYGILLLASCSGTDTSGIDTSREIVDSIVNARTDSARNSFGSRNDSIIHATARQRADSLLPEALRSKPGADTAKKSDSSKVPAPWNK